MDLKNGLDPCVVCGDAATGFHYRQMTCEGCKVRKFFTQIKIGGKNSDFFRDFFAARSRSRFITSAKRDWVNVRLIRIQGTPAKSVDFRNVSAKEWPLIVSSKMIIFSFLVNYLHYFKFFCTVCKTKRGQDQNLTKS